MSYETVPLDLLAASPEPGSPPALIGRETGFALKLWAPPDPSPAVRPQPPGQGQVLVGLTGRARIEELGGAEGRVVSTTRIPRAGTVGPGQLFRVANDARWTLVSADPGTLLLALSTSVPREVQRSTDILASAAGRRGLGAVRVFGNEAVRVDFVAARGRLPLRGWTLRARKTEGVEYLVGLVGAFTVHLVSPADKASSCRVAAGQLLRLEPGSSFRLRAEDGQPSVALVITGRAATVGGTVRREDVRGFSPFG